MSSSTFPTAAIDDLITYMTVPTFRFGHVSSAVPLIPEIMDTWNQDTGIYPNAEPNIAGSLDINILKWDPHTNNSHPHLRKKGETRYQLLNVKSLGTAAAKSMRLHPSVTPVAVRRWSIFETGEALPFPKEMWHWTKRGGWRLHRIGKIIVGESMINTVTDGLTGSSIVEFYRGILRLIPGFNLMLRYEWMVSMGYAGCSRVNIPTDAIGIYEFFKIRDIEPGKKRRAAIIHWVREHFRTGRKDPDKLISVREHIRGATDFTWQDFQVRVTPPRFDLEQLAEKGNSRARELTEARS